ncbi:MAG: GNAT family N-acetyltransferase [Clostridiales bacterium]|nr:GNAT family N-acetyltransferase [Clostridiales bacterium]
MTNADIMLTALKQSAEDIGCAACDFLKSENVTVPFRLGAGARKYYKLPIAADLVSYGNNVVAAVEEDLEQTVKEYLGRFGFYHLFETPNLNWFSDRLSDAGQRVCFMAEYFLPDIRRLREQGCVYELRLLEPPELDEFYLPEWSNALCAARRELDVLAVGAFDKGRLAGLAGCSADCDTMWQIGVDVLPEYRRRGIASALVSRLAAETINRGKIPFYCSAWSNIRSVRTAMASGFAPAWAELTVKPKTVADAYNE